ALGNEFSDHVTERVNYLWLAHSKLRVASYGPEILVGDLPADIRGTSAIVRDGKTIYYRLADNNTYEVIGLLYRLFCGPADQDQNKFSC
ncbi:MAG: GguC protein, partial [Rhodobacteraceae bacterium]|nr:GguC protein [Paracoccaceae bacterium]